MQAERRGKRIHSFFLCRGAAYLIERYRKPSAEEKEFIHFSFAEAQLILSKDTANRAQKRQTCLSDYAEMQLFLYKKNASRAQRKKNSFIFPLPRRNLSYTNAKKSKAKTMKLQFR